MIPRPFLTYQARLTLHPNVREWLTGDEYARLIQVQGLYSLHRRLSGITDASGRPRPALDGSTTRPPPTAFSSVLTFSIVQFLLATLTVIFVIFIIDKRVFNVNEGMHYYQLANGTIAQVPHKIFFIFQRQSDVTSWISVCSGVLARTFKTSLAVMTWNYAFLLLYTNGMRLETLSSMVSLPFIPMLFPPPGLEIGPNTNNYSAKRRRAIGVALVMFTAVPASYSSSLLTGAVSWRSANRYVANADTVRNIGIGVVGEDTDPWSMWVKDYSFRARYISRASALATHAWNNVTDNTTDAPTSRRVIPSLQNLPVASSLENVTVPWFNIVSFNWILNSSDLSAQQLNLLSPESTPGVMPSNNTELLKNPLQNSLRSTAILPDVPYASLNFSSDWASPQPAKLENQVAIIAVNIDYNSDCDAGVQTAFGGLPPDIYMTKSSNPLGYSNCFVFANITYSAGVATCYGCQVVFPIVVENPPGSQLTLEADVMTQHATYVMADVIGVLVQANITLPPTWNNIEGYARGILARGYSSAWTAMSELIAFYTPYLSTRATIPVTMSQAFIDHRRVWAWFALQGLGFIGNMAFLIHARQVGKYPIINPLLYGFMLNVDMSDHDERMAMNSPKAWPECFKETFIVLERGEEKSGFTIQGGLQKVRSAYGMHS